MVTTTNTQPVIHREEHVSSTQPVVLKSGPPPVATQPVVTTTTTVNQPVLHQTSQGYRFNYLPADRSFEPDIFASRVGEHGVHHGHRY